MVLVQAVVERGGLLLCSAMVGLPRLSKRRFQQTLPPVASKLKSWCSRKQVLRQLLSDRVHVLFVEVVETAQCFASSLSIGARRLIRSRIA